MPTEQACCHGSVTAWSFTTSDIRVKRGARQVEALRMRLVITGGVAASAQNRAKRALLLLHKEVLGSELPSLDDAVWATLSGACRSPSRRKKYSACRC